MKNIIQSISISLLIILYIYAAISKLLTFPEFRQQLHNQNLSEGFAGFLLYFLPFAEIVTAFLLCFRRTIIFGLVTSAILLTAFTGYISLVMLHYWDRTPCSCGGILSHMSWTTHLIFNWAFLLLNIISFYLEYSDRKHLLQLTD
jgi:hypothetical protein